MGEFEEKLNSILGDQQAMGQIMALAQSLGKQSSSDQEEKDTAPEPAEDAPPDLSQLMGNLDPKMVQLGMRLMREYQQDDGQNTALLLPAGGAAGAAGQGGPDRQNVPLAPGGFGVAGREGGGHTCITVISRMGRFIPE
mgnify:CR=1 FL=1